jgi:DNA-binding MarR family transcriptional regulator
MHAHATSEKNMHSLSPRAGTLLNLWLASQRLSASTDHALGAVHGIALVEFAVLAQLATAHDQRMRRVDLARATGRSPSGITRLLRPMEKLGLVDRERNARDARVSLVQLTPAGKQRFEEAQETLERLADRLTERIGTSQLDATNATLAQLTLN